MSRNLQRASFLRFRRFRRSRSRPRTQGSLPRPRKPIWQTSNDESNGFPRSDTCRHLTLRGRRHQTTAIIRHVPVSNGRDPSIGGTALPYAGVRAKRLNPAARGAVRGLPRNPTCGVHQTDNVVSGAPYPAPDRVREALFARLGSRNPRSDVRRRLEDTQRPRPDAVLSVRSSVAYTSVRSITPP